MPFCINCGQKLAEGAKFCASCGKAVDNNNSTSQRKTTYDGEIHKCPNCGEVLGAFTAYCPSCGYEIRGAETAKAIREFAVKLENLQSDEEKISFIRNFPIPNSKEEIIDFMILASSNIDANHLISLVKEGSCEKSIANAWYAKFEQAYEKAKICFPDDDTKIVNAIYDKKMKQIRKARLSFPKLLIFSIIGAFAFLGIILTLNGDL